MGDRSSFFKQALAYDGEKSEIIPILLGKWNVDFNIPPQLISCPPLFQSR